MGKKGVIYLVVVQLAIHRGIKHRIPPPSTRYRERVQRFGISVCRGDRPCCGVGLAGGS